MGRGLKKIFKKRDDGIKMLDKQGSQSAKGSTNDRIDKLETTVFHLFGFLFGMFLVHLLSHVIKFF